MKSYVLYSDLTVIEGNNLEEAILSNLNKFFICFDRINTISLSYKDKVINEEKGGIEIEIEGINIGEYNVEDHMILNVRTFKKREWIKGHKNELFQTKCFTSSDCQYIKDYNSKRYLEFSHFVNVDDYFKGE